MISRSDSIHRFQRVLFMSMMASTTMVMSARADAFSDCVVGIPYTTHQKSLGLSFPDVNVVDSSTSGASQTAVSFVSPAVNGANGANGGTFGHGHSGDGGGNAAPYIAVNCANLSTSGDLSRGIYLYAPGGNGGSGGDAGKFDTGTGNGGNGGNGGDLRLVNKPTFTITTHGNNSAGIFTYSLGGSGGNGGDGSYLDSGGHGAIGGNGGQVQIESLAAITTSGSSSPGVHARSEGGFAGTGGNGPFFGGNPGDGGAAGNAGKDVSVDVSGTINTQGADSDAMLLESIGGQGGDGGGSSAFIFALGASGGIGGNGGAVTGSNNAFLLTDADNAKGMSLQSIGGGGGHGGDARNVGATGGVSIGGSGGGGGNGGDVEVDTPEGYIETVGTGSHGILANSIGGGGGDGGSASGVTLGDLAVQVSIGGSGGSGGNGGDLTVSSGIAGGTAANPSMISTGATMDLYPDPVGTTTFPGDLANGILAQSIGGGGGSGGRALAVAASASPTASMSVAVGIGGHGGEGGSGGNIFTLLSPNSTIYTVGRHADAVVSQSVGGGGGSGGNTITVAAAVGETSGSVGVAIGGHGGSGGNGGGVQIIADGSISTVSTMSSGVVSRSIGGGGGSGGNVIDVAASLGKTSGSIGVSVGGSGGAGGNADSVSAASGGSISTAGHRSHGIVSQSIGGGGGSGGNVHTYAVSASAGGGANGLAAAASDGVGGTGGNGGHGSTVHVEQGQNRKITTAGDLSSGILAQSIGGGGGDGGNVFALSVAASLDTASGGGTQGGRNLSAAVAVGGSGGTGGTGGAVGFVSAAGASIATTGVRASGLVAQSIGGGGGNGGEAHSFAVSTSIPVDSARARAAAEALLTKLGKGSVGPSPQAATKNGLTASVSVGGAGGSGNVGGDVDLLFDPSATISTADTQSYGVFAQSVGGGGGSGGYAFSDGFAGIDSYGLTMGIGGNGGTGGDGGAVDITTSLLSSGVGGISTAGEQAHGILAQSIGGGGGEGGAAKSNLYSVTSLSKSTLSISLGGTGGASGDGGAVSVDFSSPIATQGDLAAGIVAQSVGGGGGTGGGTLTSGLINFALGGSGGAAGSGGGVSVLGTADISTGGSAAHGVIAQSVGGGGGIAGNAAGTGLGKDVGLNFHLGGSGGNGGDGGAVTVTRSGSIQTAGTAAFGILAQSVGGGGGLVSASTMTIGAGSIPIGISTSGDEGNGGAVTVASGATNLDITTTGVSAHGIFAQSVGSGGGIAVLPISGINAAAYTVVSASDTTASAGGNVRVAVVGDIKTSGDGAYGILAQSLASAMTVVSSDGTTQHGMESTFLLPIGDGGVQRGDVSVVQSGTIVTQGKGAHGIVATNDPGWKVQPMPVCPPGPPRADCVPSTGPVGPGPQPQVTAPSSANSISINGAVSVAGADAWGVLASSGYPGVPSAGTKIIVAAGASVTATGVGGGAISVTDGAVNGSQAFSTIEVSGTVNAASGIAVRADGSQLNVTGEGKVLGDIVRGDTGGLFVTNAGTISGSLGSASGNINQYTLAAGGEHRLGVDARGTGADHLWADTLVLQGGVIRPYLTGLPNGSVSVDHLVHGSQADGFAAALLPGSLSTVFDYTYDGQWVNLSGVSVDFRRAGLSGNDAALAELATSQLGPWTTEDVTPENQRLHDLLLDAANTNDTNELSRAFGIFDASAHFANVDAAMLASGSHLNNLQSCGTATGPFAAIAESECSWSKIAYGVVERRDGDQRHSATTLALGRQTEVSPHVFLGLSAAYEKTSYNGVSSVGDGHRVHLGGIAKFSKGPLYASTSLTASYGWSGAERRVDATGLLAVSEQETRALAARLRAAYLFEFGRLDLTPLVELDLAVIDDLGYREAGAGAFDLDVGAKTHFLADLHPAVRFGTEAMVESAMVRGYAEVGARLALNDSSISVSLPNSPQRHDAVSLNLERDEIVGTLATSAQIIWDDTVELKLGYEAGFGEETRSHAGSLKLGFKF